MSRITPLIGISGVFELKTPWVTNPGEIYTITAIQSFEELVRSGIDPKKTIYEPMQLGDGGSDFSWANEFAANPSIVTLSGSQGNIIIVPDTYIKNYPDQSSIEYSRYILAVDLGSHPSTENFLQLAKDIEDLVQTYTKFPCSTKTHTLPLEIQPTEEQHLAYMRVKRYDRTDSASHAEEIARLRAKSQKLEATVHALTTRLRNVDPDFN